jgi:hypothetical protein
MPVQRAAAVGRRLCRPQELITPVTLPIDLAIAQFAGLGVIAADFAGFKPQAWPAQGFTLLAVVAGAILPNWTGKRRPDIQEALIGAILLLAASGAMLLAAGNPHGGEHLKACNPGAMRNQRAWRDPGRDRRELRCGGAVARPYGAKGARQTPGT